MIFMVASAIALKIKSGFKYKEKIPHYGMYHRTTKTVSFFDWNGAIDMRAYIEFNGQRMEMTSEFKEETYAMFYVPKEALKSEKITVWAEDPEGNESDRETIGILEKKVINN